MRIAVWVWATRADLGHHSPAARRHAAKLLSLEAVIRGGFGSEQDPSGDPEAQLVREYQLTAAQHARWRCAAERRAKAALGGDWREACSWKRVAAMKGAMGK